MDKRQEGRIASQASEWLWKLEAADSATRASFVEWLLQSPRHIEEFLQSTAFNAELHEKMHAATNGQRHRVKAAPKCRPLRRRVIVPVCATCLLTLAAWAEMQIGTHKPPQRSAAAYLVFTGQTLAEAAAEFNRRNARQLLIDDPQVAALRISGRFTATDIDSFAATLEEPFEVQVVHPIDSRPGSGAIHLARARSGDSRRPLRPGR